MKTKDGQEDFSEIRLKHPIRYIQWITLVMFSHKKGSDCSQFNFAIMKVFKFLPHKDSDKQSFILVQAY